MNDIEASRPAAPAWVLLLSDGASTSGSDPLDSARMAAEHHVPVLAVALGRPDAMVTVLNATGGSRRIPVPPDLFQLTSIADAPGGRALAARSAPELETALDDLFRRAGLGVEQRDLTMPFAAAALLLLAIGRALTPSRRRAASGSRARPMAAVWRWLSPVALLVAAGATSVAWAQWLPTGAPPSADSAMITKLATRPLPGASAPSPSPALPASPPVAIDAATKADRTIVQQATTLLRDQGLLATQRAAEIRRRHLTEIGGLFVTACDVCRASSLTSPSPGFYATEDHPFCPVLLNTPFIGRQAKIANVPLRTLVAMAVLHEQELCLRNADSDIPPFDTEQRLAAKLHNARLFDLIYAQIDARERDWPTVEQAVVILREHGELAFQRRDDLRRRRLNQVGPLQITVCRGCRDDRVGEATTGPEVGGAVACQILLDLSGIEKGTRGSGLSVALVIASTLVHEQEHCVRHPDDREKPAIDEQRRLALKVGNARLLASVNRLYGDLDSSGYWKS